MDVPDEARPAEQAKNPVAVELGRRGGLKGGRARADQLSPEQRRAIARKAAQARWGLKAGDAVLNSAAAGPSPAAAGPSPLNATADVMAAGAVAVFEAATAAAADRDAIAGSPRLVESVDPMAAGHVATPAPPLWQTPRASSVADWERVSGLPGPDSPSQLRLTDWRRRVADLYAEVRRIAGADPIQAWQLWRTARQALYRQHPLSPVPADRRASFVARHFNYDPRWRFELPIRPEPFARGQAVGGPSAGLMLPNSGPDPLAFERVGRVDLLLGSATHRLSIFWLAGYAGGLFLPFRDATNGVETYAAGRYLLDTAKGADLGPGSVPGTIVLDFNFAFQPSCAFDPRWSCPLAPPENRLEIAIRAGERLE